MDQLPHIIWGEKTDHQPVYFAHANGYPPGSYQPLINALAEKYQVISYLQRPLWRPTPDVSSITTWHDLVDDVITFFDQNKMKNVVAVGHSLGAVTTFMAAQRRPDLIKAMVMMEPVALPRIFCWLTRFFPNLIKQRVNIIRKALNRPNRFDSLAEAFEFHRKPRVFKRISDENLWHYINTAFIEQDGEFQMTYPREWEARVYGTATYFRGQLLKSKLPVLAMRGGHSDTIDAKFWLQWKANQNHRFVDFPDLGHLLPLENPAAVIEQIMPFVESHM